MREVPGSIPGQALCPRVFFCSASMWSLLSSDEEECFVLVYISDILGQAVALFTFHSNPWYRLKSVYTVLYAKEDL